MKIGILDTKVGGSQIDDINLYMAKGYEIINAGHLDRGNKFDIVASTWTRVTEKRIKACKIKGVVIKDNDEPGNVVDVATLERLKVPYGLIGLWGINTRVNWNLKHILDFTASKHNLGNLDVLMIANTPSHDAIKPELEKRGATVVYPVTPATHSHDEVAKLVAKADVIIVHLGKDDYHRYWLDPVLPYFRKGALMISTTRGPIYSADVFNKAVKGRGLTAVLDWAWDEERLIKSDKIIHTGHSSYRSKESGTELAAEVIKAVEKMKRKLAR